MSPRPPPKISFRHDLNWTKGNDQSGSTVEQRPVGKLVQQSFGEAPRAEFSKPTQQEVDGKRLQEELGSSDGTGKPVKSEDIRVMHAHDGTGEPLKSSANTHSGRIWFCRTSWTLHHLTRTTSSTVQPTRRTSISTSQVCRMRWLNDHIASTFTT